MAIDKTAKIAEHADLVEKRAGLITRADDLATRAEPGSEEAATLDSVIAEVRDIDARLTAIEQELAVEETDEAVPAEVESEPRSAVAVSVRDLPAPPPAIKRESRRAPAGPAFVKDLGDKRSERNRDLAFRGWALAGTGKVTPEHIRAARESGLDLNTRSMTFSLSTRAPKSADFTRAGTPLATTPGAQGGYTVPREMINELEKALLYTCPIRDYCKVLRTSAGNPLELPTLDDTANKGEIIGENLQHNEDTLTFGQKVLGAYKYSSKIVRVSMELLADSAVNISEVVGSALGERIGRIQLDHFTTGTGTGQPTGLVTGAGNGGTTTASGAIGVDDLLGLISSVDLAYRANGVFMMSDATLMALRKLRYATTGEPIFNVDYRTDGSPTRLFSYPVYINNSMANVGASAKAVVFGDLNHFWIRDALEIQVMQSMERYFEFSQTGFLAVARSDSAVINSSAIKVLTVKA